MTDRNIKSRIAKVDFNSNKMSQFVAQFQQLTDSMNDMCKLLKSALSMDEPAPFTFESIRKIIASSPLHCCFAIQLQQSTKVLDIKAFNVCVINNALKFTSHEHGSQFEIHDLQSILKFEPLQVPTTYNVYTAKAIRDMVYPNRCYDIVCQFEQSEDRCLFYHMSYNITIMDSISIHEPLHPPYVVFHQGYTKFAVPLANIQTFKLNEQVANWMDLIYGNNDPFDIRYTQSVITATYKQCTNVQVHVSKPCVKFTYHGEDKEVHFEDIIFLKVSTDDVTKRRKTAEPSKDESKDAEMKQEASSSNLQLFPKRTDLPEVELSSINVSPSLFQLLKQQMELFEYQGHAVVEKTSLHVVDQDQVFIQYPVKIDNMSVFLRQYFNKHSTIEIAPSAPPQVLIYASNIKFKFNKKPHEWLSEICDLTIKFISKHQHIVDIKFKVSFENETPFLKEYLLSVHSLSTALRNSKDKVSYQIANTSYTLHQLVSFQAEWGEQITSTEMWNHRLYAMYGWFIFTLGTNKWYPFPVSTSLKHLFEHVLASNFRPAQCGAKYQFIFEKEFLEAIIQECKIYHEQYLNYLDDHTTYQQKRRDFIGICLLTGMPNYMTGVVDENKSLRLGNTVKTQLSNFFELICEQIKTHRIAFVDNYHELFKTFVHQMLTFRDIRWFLDDIMLWGCDSATNIFVTLVAQVMKEHPKLTEGMSRDNAMIINGICKNKFDPKAYAIKLISRGDVEACEKLQTKIQFDLLSDPDYVAQVYIQGDFGIEGPMGEWFRKHNKTCLTVEEAVATKNQECLQLHLKVQDKDQIMIKAYKECALKDMYDQALWLYATFQVKIRPAQLALANEKRHHLFLYKMIASQELCNDAAWIMNHLHFISTLHESDWKRHWLEAYVHELSRCCFDHVFSANDFKLRWGAMEVVDGALTDSLCGLLTTNECHDEVSEKFMQRAIYFNRVFEFPDAIEKLPKLIQRMKKTKTATCSSFVKPFIDIVEGLYRHPQFSLELKHLYVSLDKIFGLLRSNSL